MRIRIHGGASDLRFHRPRDVPARLDALGAVSRLRFDDRAYRPVEGYEGLESPGYGSARNRYDVEIAGGASNLVFDFR